MSEAVDQIKCKCGQLIPERNITQRYRYTDKDTMFVKTVDYGAKRDPAATARRDMTPEERQMRDTVWASINEGREQKYYIDLRYRCPRCRKWGEQTVVDDHMPPEPSPDS